MVKASAGGGGKGIRKVEAEADLDAAIATASQEAQAAFGDGRLLIEKFVTRPRHVEVQIAGDRHGNIRSTSSSATARCSAASRSCWKRRLHAPRISSQARAALHEHALKLSRAISYDNLGTVEFLVDAVTQESILPRDERPRLQVEHPDRRKRSPVST